MRTEKGKEERRETEEREIMKGREMNDRNEKIIEMMREGETCGEEEKDDRNEVKKIMER